MILCIPLIEDNVIVFVLPLHRSFKITLDALIEPVVEMVPFPASNGSFSRTKAFMTLFLKLPDGTVKMGVFGQFDIS